MDTGIIILFALLLGGMWLMSNRTRKQQQKAQAFRDNLQPGDEVMTGSGLFATVVSVDADVVTLEASPGNQTRWLKAAISKLVEPPAEPDEDPADNEEYDEDYEDEELVDDDAIDVPDDLSSLDEPRKPADGEAKGDEDTK